MARFVEAGWRLAPLNLPVYLNGRFLAQRLSGVQRFATEISLALQILQPGPIKILVPPDAEPGQFDTIVAGRRTGHFWEQVELPRHAKGGILVNLGNSAPVFGGRQIVVIHDAGVFSTPEAYSRPFRLWYKVLQFALSRGRAQIVTVSAFSQNELARHLHLPAARIRIIGEGADHMARIIADDTVLAANNLSPGQYVLVVGTLAAHKNLGSLSILAERLAARGQILAITGAFGAAAFQNDGTAKLPQAARYLGRVSDQALKALYENAACFVFPSRYEGFGLPAVEAMACGCAVVAADIPALRETCGAAAVYCDPYSPEAIADIVMTLLDDPPRLAAFRQAALNHAAGLTWAKAAGALYNIIKA